VESAIKSAIQTERVIVTDVSGGCGAKFEIVVVSKAFEGVPLLERHRKVNQALEDLLKQIHAITIKAWTPVQYEEKKKVPSHKIAYTGCGADSN